jgi:hypothetical protein
MLRQKEQITFKNFKNKHLYSKKSLKAPSCNQLFISYETVMASQDGVNREKEKTDVSNSGS